MRERPILMSAPMVRALLAGTKTQTRRVVKPAELQRADDIEPHESYPGEWSPWIDGERRATIECPYGVPSDRLWCRETFSYTWNDAQGFDDSGEVWYWADGNPNDGDWGKPRPSIHMPRWACRITLEITDVRVERLQEISEADAMAEGIGRYDNGTFGLNDPGACMGTTAVVAYMRLWETINGAGSWDLNPWVWAISFRRIGDA